MNSSHASLLRVLYSLRWIAVVGQTISILLATGPMGLHLPQLPLWAGVCVLIIFNIYVYFFLRRGQPPSPWLESCNIAVDMCVLAWMVAWSGGISNPFGSLFLVFIALAAMALPTRWAISIAVTCCVLYGLSISFGHPLPKGRFDPLTLSVWGIEINFFLSSIVLLAFITRLSGILQKRENEIALLRERFTRNEGIMALATHAASVAHALNTPLATMTLIADDIREQCNNEHLKEDLETLRGLLQQCHERVLALAAPAEQSQHPLSVQNILDQWQLVRPTITLQRNADAPMDFFLEPSIGHLLMVLLNNAADAGVRMGHAKVDLTLRISGQQLFGEIRDYGAGFDSNQTLLPGKLFNTSKIEGMGVGLALSHATVERLNGSLWMEPVAKNHGVRVCFHLCLGANK